MLYVKVKAYSQLMDFLANASPHRPLDVAGLNFAGT